MGIQISLNNKVALITGATGQLGQALVKTFAECGAAIIIHYYRNKKKAEELCQKLLQDGKQAICAGCDITDKDDVLRMKDEIACKTGLPDILVINAISPLIHWNHVLNEDPAAYMEFYQTCVMQTVLLSQIFLPSMIKKNYGRVIGINSESSMLLRPTQSAYSAAKRAMDGVLRVLAKETGEYGITVNQVAPGFLITPETPESDDPQLKFYKKFIPLQRRGTPDEVSYTVAFLASDLAQYISGVYIPVCGGNIMPAI